MARGVLEGISGQTLSENITQKFTANSAITSGDLCDFTSGQAKKCTTASPKVVALENVASGSVGKFLITGLANVFTGLIPNNTYYCDTSGNLTTANTGYLVGVAISATEMVIKKPWWERGL